jgi:hypothetical protein
MDQHGLTPANHLSAAEDAIFDRIEGAVSNEIHRKAVDAPQGLLGGSVFCMCAFVRVCVRA